MLQKNHANRMVSEGNEDELYKLHISADKKISKK